ncbi:MAG: hypothetical protein WAK45_06910 [Methanoregula sp.]|uniref:hypothetical protein n=2 Tax=Methanoregula sp. TaxID=2052170 RepID=UPI003BB0B354
MNSARWIGFLIILAALIPVVSANTPTTGHPFLLFHDISQTPGYQYQNMDPWNTWQNSILSGADRSLALDFSGNLGAYDRVQYRAGYARDLGLAYQITKKPQYATKAKEALLNLSVGTISEKVDKANALGEYCLAYDFIQPTLDPATDTIIRDKLATLADMVYGDLNGNGTTRNYVSFADYHGQAYPMMGIAGAALYDYTNPNHFPLTSTPADWQKVGTDYLFVNDQLHSYNRSLFSFGFDETSGKYLNGAYKFYVYDDLDLWLQVAYHAYGENLLDIYPAAKKGVTTEIWDSLPNNYASNYVTNGNTGWAYQTAIISLLSDSEKGPVLNHIDLIENSTVLPFSRFYQAGPPALLYCVYGNYASIPRSFPTNTSYLDPNSIFQVFRGSWNDDADWLSLVTFNVASHSNRDSLHGDQLAFEYYSRGDLLLADAGENKYVLDRDYGYYDIDHNTLSLEDPRTPFPVSPWSNSASAGIFKGNASGIATPVTVSAIAQVPWMQLEQANAQITSVMTQTLGNSQTLSSPIQYERTILYPVSTSDPKSNYFIVVDRMEGTESWVFRNIFRPTSLMVTPTTNANKDNYKSQSEVGHVNGALSIGTTPYNWQTLPYKAETDTGLTTDSFSWATTNPYGNDVNFNLVSSPASDILIEKNVGRIGGYEAESEVFNPIVYFRSPDTTSLYRVTVLLSSYSNETPKTASEIQVNGNGHALQVHSSSYDDYIYTGEGVSSFAGFSTDADTVFIRKGGDTEEITLLNGSYLDDQNDRIISLSKNVDILTLSKVGDQIDYRISGNENVGGSLFANTTNTAQSISEGIYTQDNMLESSALASNVESTLGSTLEPITNQEDFISRLYSFVSKVIDTIKKL